MVVFPNAKINLGLRILEKRKDGYHNLKSAFYPIPYKDILEITPSKNLTLNQTGLGIGGNPEDNLCLKAYNLLSSEYNIPSVTINLHKVIPMGAGLGGGSADGAFTLRALNTLFELNLSGKKLITLALQLGADCPFFIDNIPSIGGGIGENLTPLNLTLKGYSIALINPEIHISTADAFRNVNISGKDDVEKNLKLSPSIWRDNLCNDFEKHIFKIHPILNNIKSTLYDRGAIYSSMSGSGSTIYGLFEQRKDNLSLDYSIKWFNLE